MLMRKYANRQYSGDVQFEFEELEIIHEGQKLYADGTAIINYEAETDDRGCPEILDYEIYQIHEIIITDEDHNNIEANKELCKLVADTLFDTPKKRDRLDQEIYDAIEDSMSGE